jgi:uncharacterized protein with beta-barrel porin domain
LLNSAPGDEAVSFIQIAEQRSDAARSVVAGHLDDACNAATTTGLWAQGGFDVTKVAGDAAAGASGYTDHTSQLAVGVDRAYGSDVTAGAALMLNNDSLSFDGRASNGRTDGAQALLYGQYAPHQSVGYLKGMASLGWWQNTLSRTIHLGTDSGTSRGTFDTTAYAMSLEGGLKFETSTLKVQPYAGVGFGGTHQQSFSDETDQGSGLFNQNFGGGRSTYAQSNIGVRLGKAGSTLLGHAFDWQVDVSWNHRFGPRENGVNAAFADSSSYNYRVVGSRLDVDQAQMGVGVEYHVTGNASVFGRVNGSIGNNNHSYGGNVGAIWRW